jgi:hypothetical protein
LVEESGSRAHGFNSQAEVGIALPHFVQFLSRALVVLQKKTPTFSNASVQVEMAGVEPASEMHEPWALRAQLLI